MLNAVFVSLIPDFLGLLITRWLNEYGLNDVGTFFYGPSNLRLVLNICSYSTRMQDLGPKLHPCAAAVAGRGPGFQASAKLQSQAPPCTSSAPRLL